MSILIHSNKIVINFDKDEPRKHPITGEIHYPNQARQNRPVASLFPLGKCRILMLARGKDACDYSRNGFSKEYTEEWWKAPIWTPEGLRIY